MRRTIPLLTIILAVQIGLAALLAVRSDPLASTTPQTPLIESSIQSVDHLLIEAHTSPAAPAGTPAAATSTGTSSAATRVELVRQNGKWILPDYFNAPADKFKLSDVLDELSDLKRGLPIATTSSALERFKLMDDDFERRLTLSAGSKVLSTVYFGSSTGVRKTDARTARDHAVYDVDLATYELPTQPSDWFDAGMLESDADALSQLDVTANGQPTVQLLRQRHSAAPAPVTAPTSVRAALPAASGIAASSPAPASGAAATVVTPAPGSPAAPVWVDPTPPAGHQVDGAHVDALARDIAGMRVAAILGLSAQPQWQQDHPLLTLVIHDDKHPGQADTWTLSQPVPTAGASPAAASASSAATRANRRAAASAASGPAVPGVPAARPSAGAADYYVLKDSAEPWYFRVSAAAGRQLLDDGAPTALLTAPQSASKQSAHASPDASGAPRAHRKRRSTAST